ncbi:MAG: coproporphyrinogen III oxidase, partial [bacterium]
GFDDLSADLMFGLPGQDVAGWKRDLTEVLSWPLTHLSCYELTIEGDTAFGQHPPALPDEDAVLAQWDTVLDETARAGFNQYEVSNYARPGKECRHNLKYWRDEDWFGFGASAWEAQGGVRRGNPRSLAKYFAGREAGFPPAETDSLPESGRMAETLVLGLRLRAGVDEGEYAARYGADALARYLPALAPHEAAGRVERAEGRLRLTPPGLLVANDVWGDIYEASNS